MSSITGPKKAIYAPGCDYCLTTGLHRLTAFYNECGGAQEQVALVVSDTIKKFWRLVTLMLIQKLYSVTQVLQYNMCTR